MPSPSAQAAYDGNTQNRPNPNSGNIVAYNNNAAAYQNDNLNRNFVQAQALMNPALRARANGSVVFDNNYVQPQFAVDSSDTAARVGRTQLAQAALAQGAQGPTSLQLDGDARARQMALLPQQAQLAMGQGPSAAAIGTSQAQQGNLLAQLQAMGNSRPGMNGNLMHQQFAQQALGQSQEMARAGAMARSQEMGQALGAYGQSIGGIRAQDLEAAQGNAGVALQNAQRMNQMNQFNTAQGNQFTLNQGALDSQRNLTNTQLQNAGRDRTMRAMIANQAQEAQVNDMLQAREMAALGMMQGVGNTQLNASQALDAARQNAFNTARATQAGIDAGDKARDTSIWGSALGAIGSMGAGALMMSDERLKTDIDRDATRADVRALLDNLDVATYRYKDPKHGGDGKKWGIIAQSLQKTDAGRSLVVETPDGLGVDTSSGFGTLMAAIKDVHERTKKLETKRR